MQNSRPKNRLETLDQLRGFFIVTIIIDHLSRFSSLFAILSGKGLLWVTAAEGFVAISGLLVGYVRGYKNRNEPFRLVATKLLKRALLLYVWSLIASIFYIAVIWYVPLMGGSPGTPFAKGDWIGFIEQLITLRYTWVWVHFLTLYALFLAAAPIAVWLMRRNLAWVVEIISFALLWLGWVTRSEALQWQFLFFIPSIAGFYLHNIIDWWYARTKKAQILIATSIIFVTVITIATSVIFTYYAQSFTEIASYVNNVIYSKDSISLARAATAFLWFVEFILIFHVLKTVITKVFNWLLIPIGTHSLTAYILHGVALCIVSLFTVAGSNFWINTLLGIIAVMITWSLLKIPFVRKVIPA